MAYTPIPNSIAELERMFMSTTMVAAELGCAFSSVMGLMHRYNRRPVNLAGKAAYFRSDVEEVLAKMQASMKNNPAVPQVPSSKAAV